MGLLKILSRRPLKEEDVPQVTSHQRTRSISTPVAFASPFSSQAPNSGLSLGGPVEEEHDMWTGLPPAPSFRSYLADDRPGSAHSAHSSRSTGSNRPRAERPKREPRRPPVSFRKPSTLSLTQLASAQEASAQRLGEAASETGARRESRDRAGSMSSLTKRRSVDLLDAVEELKPLNFRSRVYATGARDYGEDVADRNIMMHSALSGAASTPDMYSLYSSDRSASAQSGWQARPRTISRTGSIDTLNNHADFSHPTHRGNAPSVVIGDPMTSFSRKNKMRLSLNTYQPSGLISSGLLTPRSAVTTPGHRGGLTPRDFDFYNANSTHFEPPNVNSPLLTPDTWSRQYHKSPTASNFSIPRSPQIIRHPLPEVNKQEPNLVEEMKNSEDEPGFVDIPTVHRSNSRKSTASRERVPLATAARFSQGTYRSSVASTVTSRYPSMDFQPLAYPKSHGHGTADFRETSILGAVPGLRERSHSLRSNRPSRSNSNESYSHQKTRSLLIAPSGLNDLVEMDEKALPVRSSSIRDWTHITPTDGSTASSSSNGIYSGTSGSGGRPTSRHTNTTSIDSTPRPISSQSYLSASIDHSSASAGGWSPTGTAAQSTGFNIDDYISSDDDSFVADKKQRPTGEDEGDLLFKDGYGVTGAALPGLLESMMDVCLPPIPQDHRASRLSPPPTASAVAHEEEEEEADDIAAAAAPDINDDRPSSGSPYSSPSSSSRSQRLRHAQSSPDHDLLGTFGRSRGGPAAVLVRPRAKSSKQAPSWLPSDDWARHSAAQQQMKRQPSVLVTVHRGLYKAAECDEAAAHQQQQQPPCRGQKRLSALGTPYGRGVEAAVGGWGESGGSGRGEGGLKRSVSNGSSSSMSRHMRKELQVVVPLATSPIKEEGVDPGLAARLRKEAKARKRDEEARLIQEKRMTKGFGGDEEEEVLARVQELLDQIDRGRARMRVGKGKGVAVE